MTRLISAAFRTPLDGVAPAEFVFIPEGTHEINPSVNGEPGEITSVLTPEIGDAVAAKLNDDLKKRNEGDVVAWFDFDHEKNKASARPKSFRYVKGKGIMVAVDWTESGKRAIEGKDYQYFSPEWLINKDDGTPAGLDEKGPYGGLVNEPAFRSGVKIAAKSNGTSPEPNNPTIMTKVFAKLGIDPAHQDAEHAAVSKIKAMEDELDKSKAKAEDSEKEVSAKDDAIKAKQDEIDKLQAELDEMKAKAEAQAGEYADKEIEAAVNDGRIAAKDEDTKTEFRTRIAAGDSFALKALKMLPTKFDLKSPTTETQAASQEEKITPYEKVKASFAE